MLKRLLPILALIALPTGVWADEAAPAAATPSAGAGSSLQPTAVDGQSGNANALQPAGGSGLGAQSARAAGLTPASGSALQGATSANDQARQLLATEADGAPQQPSETSEDGQLWLDGGVLALLLLAGLAGWWIRRRQLIQARIRFAHPDA